MKTFMKTVCWADPAKECQLDAKTSFITEFVK